MPNVELTLRPDGRGRVVVNGVDLSNAVAAVEVQAAAGKKTSVRLLVQPATLKLNAEAAEILKTILDEPEGA